MITLILILLISIDQISKCLVLSKLAGNPPVEIIPNFFRLMYVENRGAAFGILQHGRPLFIAITLIVIAFLAYALYGKNKNLSSLMRASLVLILAGAIGNFIDRLRLHFVVDFLSFNIFGRPFAVFNLADSMIVIGTITIIESARLNTVKCLIKIKFLNTFKTQKKSLSYVEYLICWN